MEILHPTDDDVELDFEADLRAQDAWRESQLMQETGGLGSMARGILRPGGRHTVVCKHWLRDLCMKGDKCDFLHQYDLARMPECPQWARFGKCPDNDCDFRHDTEKMECQKYKFGFCKLGSQCRMRHDKLSRAYLPETVPDWYLKEIISNFFDLVPALPEETVRFTSGADPSSALLVNPQSAPAQMWTGGGGLPQPAAPPASDLAWAAPAAPSWGAPIAPLYPKPNSTFPKERVVVDLTEEKQQPWSRRGEKPERRPEKRREPDRREILPTPPQRRERLPSLPRRERHPSPPRRDRHPSPATRRPLSPPRREVDRRDRGRREEERLPDRGGPRPRSRSYDRGREDRGRPRR